jgi:hypothetical protein
MLKIDNVKHKENKLSEKVDYNEEENDWSCIYVLGVSILLLFLRFPDWILETVLTVYNDFFFTLLNNKSGD